MIRIFKTEADKIIITHNHHKNQRSGLPSQS